VARKSTLTFDKLIWMLGSWKQEYLVNHYKINGREAKWQVLTKEAIVKRALKDLERVGTKINCNDLEDKTKQKLLSDEQFFTNSLICRTEGKILDYFDDECISKMIALKDNKYKGYRMPILYGFEKAIMDPNLSIKDYLRFMELKQELNKQNFDSIFSKYDCSLDREEANKYINNLAPKTSVKILFDSLQNKSFNFDDLLKSKNKKITKFLYLIYNNFDFKELIDNVDNDEFLKFVVDGIQNSIKDFSTLKIKDESIFEKNEFIKLSVKLARLVGTNDPFVKYMNQKANESLLNKLLL